MGKYFEFEVSMRHIKPRIWRRFLLAAEGTTFMDLHEAIQDAGTWTDSHLWMFREGGRRGKVIAVMPADPEIEFDGMGMDDPPADEVLLCDFFEKKGQKCEYMYDMGDGWEHEVALKKIVESPEKFYRRLVDGKRAFPLEDCGGWWGYYACLAVVKPEVIAEMGLEEMDPEDIEERREWVGDWDPEAFELERVKKGFDARSVGRLGRKNARGGRK